MNSSPKAPDQPIAAGGGLPEHASTPPDPFSALDDLMVVVEALCPKWPEREPTVTTNRMLL